MNERIVAGAPVKHAPIVTEYTQLDRGVWREVRSDGSIVIVVDLTSALWTWKPQPAKRKR